MLGVVKKNVQPGDIGVQVLSWEHPVTSRGGQLDYTYCEDVESRTVNLVLDRDIQPDPVTAFANATYEGAFWTVSWLSGNAGQKAEIDVQNGTFITVVGRNVNVQVSYPKIVTTDTQLTMDVRAVLGFDGGQAGAGLAAIARRTQRIGVVPAGATTIIFPIPRFAVAAVVRNSVIGIPTMVLNQLRGNNGASAVNASMVGKLEQDTISICDGATFFEVQNTSANPANDVSVVFYLGL